MDLSLEDLNLALDYLCQDFGGEWLLLGGSLVRVDLDPTRGTHDIDLCRIDTETVPEKTRLIEAMKLRGISPEQMNSAVGYFLRQHAGWEAHIKLLKEGKKGKIFRPTLTLFASLKLKRGSPVDQNDLRLAILKWGLKEFDSQAFLAWTTSRELELAQRLGLPL